MVNPGRSSERNTQCLEIGEQYATVKEREDPSLTLLFSLLFCLILLLILNILVVAFTLQLNS